MSEPETLNTDEPLPERVARHWFDRLIMLSDGVFAIAMTLLALEVRPPHHWDGTLLDLLGQTWRALFGYAMSFLIVAYFWLGNRSIVARLRRVDTPYSLLTLFFLCMICLTPFAVALVAEHGPGKALRFYAFLVAGTGVAQALLWTYAAFWRDLLYAEVGRNERRFALAAFLTMPLLFCGSGLAIGSGAGEWVVLPTVLVAAVMGRMRRRMMARAGMA